MPALTRFILLYAAMYAAFGVASPFLPAFLTARGLPPEQLGLVLGAGTAVRLLTSPLAGRIGDLLQALRVVLVACIALAAAVTLGYLGAHGFLLLLCVSLLHAAALAPITILAPAVDLTNATGAKLRFTPVAPTTITLPNSGNTGIDFNIGGTLAITSTTADGNYTGIVTVTADYQ